MDDLEFEAASEELASVIPWSRQKPTVAVIGDAILDEYLEGEVSRISPEAPVPVHLVKNTVHRPGGAANAALNIQTVGAEAILFSVIGADESGQRLKKILDDHGVRSEGLLALEDRPTIRKTRVTAGIQQLIRVDWEKQVEVEMKTVKMLMAKLEATKWDALLISDYGKGLLSDEFLDSAISLAQDRRVPVVVDPKRKDFSAYSRATVITPNRKEACLAIGFDSDCNFSGEDIGTKLIEKFHFKNVLVTLGSRGMVLVTGDSHSGVMEKSLSLKALAREVYDVSGAGDTVAAIMAVGLGCSAPIEYVVKLANTAAALVVGKVGTQPVFKKELLLAMLHESSIRIPRNKILSMEEITKTFETQSVQPRNRKAKIVFTNGCFDIIHAGHVSYLEKAREKGDLLVIGVNSDESIKRIKGPSRPIMNLRDRLKVLSGLECVDYLIPFTEDTPEALIRLLSPNVLVKGGDYRPDVADNHQYGIVGSEFVRSIGGQVLTVPLVPGISTTEIISRINGKS